MLVGRYESFLEKVQLLDGLSKEQRNRMVDALEEVQYEPGETIINEDENGTHFYMIVEGNVSVSGKLVAFWRLGSVLTAWLSCAVGDEARTEGRACEPIHQ